MPVREEPFADRLLVRERDLAAEEAGGERGHAGRVDACERLRPGGARGCRSREHPARRLEADCPA